MIFIIESEIIWAIIGSGNGWSEQSLYLSFDQFILSGFREKSMQTILVMPAWINNYIKYKIWDQITYSFSYLTIAAWKSESF